MTNIERFINPLLKQLDELPEKGFATEKTKYRPKYGQKVYQWVQKNDWIKYCVILSHMPNDPLACSINFQVYLLVEGEEKIFEGINLSARSSDNVEFRFPWFFKSLRAKKYIRALSQEVFDSLEWFERFSTKRKCWEMVLNPELNSNVPRKSDTPYFKSVERLLNS